MLKDWRVEEESSNTEGPNLVLGCLLSRAQQRAKTTGNIFPLLPITYNSIGIFRILGVSDMPPITGVGGTFGVSQPLGGEPTVSVEVALPSANPTRDQVVDAFYARFGFNRADTDFLKERFGGTDPFAHSARTLKYDPRSVQVKDGKATLGIKISAEAYQAMRELAEAHHQQPSEVAPTPINSTEGAQAKRVYDTSSAVRERMHWQVDQAQSGEVKSTEGIVSFLAGAVAGDFTENDSWSKTGGQIAASGFTNRVLR